MERLPFDFMKRFIKNLKNMDEEVAVVCSHLNDHMLEDPELIQFAQEHLNNSHVLLDLCIALQEYMDSAQERLILKIEKLEKQFDGEKQVSDKILEDLKEDLHDISSGEICQIISSVNARQNRFLTRLSTKSKNLNKKLSQILDWRRALRIVSSVASFAAPIVAFVGHLLETPSIMVTITVASMNLITMVDVWSESLQEESKKVLKGQENALREMVDGTLKAINNVFGILVSVARLQRKIRKMKKTKEFATVREMNEKLKRFLKKIKELEQQADRCGQDIRQLRIVVLQIITEPTTKA